MTEFFVYMVRCSDGSYYVGHTDNLELRLSHHKTGAYCCYTSSRLPVQLVFHQKFDTREAAFLTERKIKGWTRKKKEALIRDDWNFIKMVAKKKFRN